MKSIKIISGYSGPGGSTIAHINLCNLFNEHGLDCTFYGPDSWHLGRCSADTLRKVSINTGDNLIVHFLRRDSRPEGCRRIILSCHETSLYPVRNIRPFWDAIHYVSEAQMKWHGVAGFVVPNCIGKLEKQVVKNGVAGIVGSIDENKQTHISIQRALDDGYQHILLYGQITDRNYYDKYVRQYIDSGKAVCMGHLDDQQGIYNSVEAVYHSSRSETYNLVKAECKQTDTIYRGVETSDPDVAVCSNDQILAMWKQLLEIEQT